MIFDKMIPVATIAINKFTLQPCVITHPDHIPSAAKNKHKSNTVAFFAKILHPLHPCAIIKNKYPFLIYA